MQTATNQTIEQLRHTLLTKWPEATPHTPIYTKPAIGASVQNPLQIGLGEIAELIGAESSGKTSLATRMLTAQSKETAYWISLSGKAYFLPTTHNIHLEVESLKEAITLCQTIIGAAAMRRIVLDFSNLQSIKISKDSLTAIWYNLRRIVVRQYAHLIILTPENATLLPDSIVTKKIHVSRNTQGAIQAHILRSRTGGEGMHYDVADTA